MRTSSGSSAGGASALLAGAILFAVVAVVAALSSGPPTTGDEAANLLAAQSLARDGDLVLSNEDEARVRSWGWPETARPRLRLMDENVLRFAQPWFYPILLAPFARVLPVGGPVVLNLLLLAVAAFAARRSVSGNTWLIVAAIFGSVLPAYLALALPVVFLVAATAVAFSLVATPGQLQQETVQQIYHSREQELSSSERWRLVARAAVAGLLLGMVGAHHPVYLLLAVAAATLWDWQSRKVAVPALALGLAVSFLVSWPVSGLWPGVDRGLASTPQDSQIVLVSIGDGPTEIERADYIETSPVAGLRSGSLLAWNAVYAIAGANVGVVPYFLALLPIVLLWRRWQGSGLLLVSLSAVLLTLIAAPFDFAGLPAALGSRAFVPFYVALWWLPTRPFGPRTSVVTIAVSLAVLLPLWSIDQTALERLHSGSARALLLARLPLETTQRELPVGAEVVTRDLLVRSVGGLVSGGRSGHFRMAKGSRADLLIAAQSALAGIDLEFDAQAAAELVVSGGAVDETMLTPSGGVVFRVRLAGSRVSHPVWWSDDEHSFYRLELEMPGAKGETAFSISTAR